jgi:5-deoxy-D-glucuronate isomerase
VLGTRPAGARSAADCACQHAAQRAGKGANTRYVTDILPQTEPADGLLVVEVITPSGHSSSYPPHKHDMDSLPAESALEETYYHRIDPPQGFAFQRVYTDDRSLDESHAVENHDVMMVPRGYHPVCALWLPVLLPERDGRAQAPMVFPQRPTARMAVATA